ncbi:MAG TPA: right-handed parallel beta-helix repeat-containing protein [Chitinophagaceae bacterium]
MTKKSILLSLVIASFLCGQGQEKPLTKGLRITKSVKIKKQTYKLDAPVSPDAGLIVIEGNNITVDFNNAVLRGSNFKKKPDEFFGVAILIRSGNNITIKNLKARGYKVALLARGITNLTIENCDFSYNYRQHLNSTQEKEDISDWLSHHQNEKDEWLRYGAAMYLRDCESLIIKNTKVTGGQNALMMTNCNNGKIYNNDFSFNSGLGIAMYRSSFNTVAYNKINFNVRGYSDGVYNRGQDSAGILVYEQSNSNLFYKNSATHGGDGFFLWAGQTTMDSGKGGCNDNVLRENDFSYAPTNGIEVTFSRNIITDNRIFECDHGIWGGYSYNTVIAGNQFRLNRIAIAIEHGQDNQIHHNIFHQNKEAIRLWARKTQPADWGYAKSRDTRSRDYAIVNNNFNNNPLVMSINRTEKLIAFDNIYAGYETLFKTDSTVVGFDTTYNDEIYQKLSADSTAFVPDIPSPQNVFAGSTALAGRKNIMITEWGPYDFRSPIIWNTNPTDTTGIMKFDLIGPKGKWKIKRFKGVKDISLMNGTFPAKITAIKTANVRTDILIELEYMGSAITTTFGETIAAGKPYTFSFKKFFQPIDFNVVWYGYDFKMHDPVKTGMIIPPTARLRPIKEEKTTKLDYAWWGGIKTDTINHPQFVTSASGSAIFEKGNYELGVTWDDVVRVYVDGKLVVDEWNPSLYKFDESPHKTIKLALDGKHSFTVEHVEIGGFATLSLKLKKL